MNASGVPEKHAGLSLKKMTNGATFAPLPRFLPHRRGKVKPRAKLRSPGAKRKTRRKPLLRALPEASKTGRLGRSPHAEQGNSAVRQAKKESPCPPPPQKTPAENECGERPPANAKPPPGNAPRKRRKNERPGPLFSRLRREGRRTGTAPGEAQTTRAPSLPARRRGNVTLPAGRA